MNSKIKFSLIISFTFDLKNVKLLSYYSVKIVIINNFQKSTLEILFCLCIYFILFYTMHSVKNLVVNLFIESN